MSNKIKVGVVGVGALGWHHARLYKECESAELVGVYDLNEERAQEVAEKLETQVYTDPSKLAEQAEALSVAVPTNHHADVAGALLGMGKHLLIEKPITETTEQAKQLMAAAEAKGLIVQVGHVERFNPVISYLEEKVDNPRFIESHRLSSYPPPRPGLPPRGTEVSVVLDLMIHDIDMVLSLVKSPVKDVQAVGFKVLSPTEDIANARITFENGCVANLTASRVTPEPVRKIRLFQSNCYLSLDYQERRGEIYTRTENGIAREAVPVSDHNALLKQLEHFLDCVAELKATGIRPQPKVSAVQGMRALELAEDIVAKARLVNPL